MHLLYFLLIGLFAGFLAGIIMKGRGMGFLGNLVVGVVGAYIGGFLFRIIGLSAYGLLGNIIMATAGAVVPVSYTHLTLPTN